MPKLIPQARAILLLVLLSICSWAQTAPETTLPIEVQRQSGDFYFVAEANISGFRVALYDLKGNRITESEALTGAPVRWPVLTSQGTGITTGVYLGVFWMRGQDGVAKQLARLEVRANAMLLQDAESYLSEVEPDASVYWGSPEYRVAERRAYERGKEAIPFFRLATKVLPDESAAYLLLSQAIQLKYARFSRDLLTPPPPPPPPPPMATMARSSKKQGAKTTSRKQKVTPSEPAMAKPTPDEVKEMLTASQQAVAVAKTCPEKSYAQLWLAAIQGDVDKPDDQLATLEQLAQASCASNEIKTQIYYSIGVLCWQCTYNLTTRYADRKVLVRDPFHYRNIAAPGEQHKFSECLKKGFAALDKAISLDPDYADAWSYRSLLHREQQKTTDVPAEQQQFSDLAEQAAQRAMELTRKRQRQ